VEGSGKPIEVESDLGSGIVRALSIVTLLAVLGLLGAAGWLFVIYPDTDGPVSDVEEVHIQVSEGMTLRQLATQLQSEGVIEDARVWSLYMRMRRLDRHLRQGKVRFRVPMTPEEAARHATTRLGRIQVRILIPEGFSRFEIAARLDEYGVCDADDFLDATEDAALLASYGVEANDAEGYLFPDTYEFDDDTRPRRVVERMLANWTAKYERGEGSRGAIRASKDGGRVLEPPHLQSIPAASEATSRPDGPIWLRGGARGGALLRRLRRPDHPGHARRPEKPVQYLPAFGASARPDQQPGEGCDGRGNRS
jgi:UPF0755 protein